MRLLFNIILLLFITLSASAQKKEISAAKDNIKKNRNLEQAEQSMKKLLEDSLNRSNLRIWNTMYDAIYKQYLQGNEKLYLKQKYDTTQLFNILHRMFIVAEDIDSLSLIPDKKGRKEVTFRKKHAETLNLYRPNLFNGGLFYIRKQKFSEAYNLLDTYIDCMNQPLFSQYNYGEKDRRIPEAAYWAVYCGYKMGDPKSTLHHTYLALKDTAHYCLMLQYLAETYKLEKDTARYLGTLEEGFKKFPKFDFFFPRLVQYYGDAQDWQRVLDMSCEGLRSDSTNTLFKLTKSTALLNLERYQESIAISDSLIALDDSIAGAWLNAGLSYFNMAVSLDKLLRQNKKQKQKIIQYFTQSMPYLEKYRALAPDQQSRWALPLYTIYLYLNKGEQFDEMDKILRGMKQ
jgi:hypothetical protein